MSTAEDLSSNNWKFDFFNYTSVQLEVIVITQRTMFEVKCTDCGQNAMVPFKPTAGKPVYGRACFSKHTSNRSENTPRQAILARNKLGRGEEIMRSQKRMTSIIVCSTGLTTRPKKKLFRKDSLSRLCNNEKVNFNAIMRNLKL